MSRYVCGAHAFSHMLCAAWGIYVCICHLLTCLCFVFVISVFVSVCSWFILSSVSVSNYSRVSFVGASAKVSLASHVMVFACACLFCDAFSYFMCVGASVHSCCVSLGVSVFVTGNLSVLTSESIAKGHAGVARVQY